MQIFPTNPVVRFIAGALFPRGRDGVLGFIGFVGVYRGLYGVYMGLIGEILPSW